jgi:sugar phosphate isomerase/epimerase
MGMKTIQLCENLDLLNLSAATLERLRESARLRGIRLQVGMLGLDQSTLQGYLQLAETLGVSLLRWVPWTGQSNEPPLSRQELRRKVEALLPSCRQAGLTLAIENYFGLGDNDLAGLLAEMDDPNLGVCLDTVNSVGRLEQPLATVRKLAPYTVTIHLKDFRVLKTATGYQITGCPLGQGWLDATAVLDEVARNGRTPDLLLELWVDPQEAGENLLATEQSWLMQSNAYAQARFGAFLGQSGAPKAPSLEAA